MFAFVDSFTRTLLEPIVDALRRAITTLIHLQRNVNAIHDEMLRLRARADEIETRNMVATSMGQEILPQVKYLLQKISQCEAEVSALEYRYHELHSIGCTPNLRKRYNLGARAYRLLYELRQLQEDIHRSAFFGVFVPPPEVQISKFERIEVQKPLTTVDLRPKNVVRSKSELEVLNFFIHKVDCKIIGIYGTGGVGKSYLLQEFVHYLQHDGIGRFQVVVYVTVSNGRGLNVEAIQKQIHEGLDLLWEEDQSVNHRANMLNMQLRNRNYVLILDDIRSKFDLGTIGIPSPRENTKGKLIVVSRTLQVCKDMESDKKNIKAKPLTHTEAMELFKRNLSKEARDAAEARINKKYVNRIVRLCNGMPVSLIVISKVLANKTFSKEWKECRDSIKSLISTADGEYMPLLHSRLEIGYYALEEHLQPCLLYICLFPENYSITDEQLLEYWIAEEYVIDKGETMQQGLQYIKKLKEASLLSTEDAKSGVKLSVVIRDMLIWTACDKGTKHLFLTEAGSDNQTAPADDKWKAAQKISLMNTVIEELPDSPKCDALETLLLQNNIKLERISKNFFSYMPLLKVLDLSYTRLEELPIPAGALPKLRYLNLRHTHINTLPEGLASLENLIFLDLSWTSCLRSVPKGVFSRLLKLHVLNMYCSLYSDWVVKAGNANQNRIQLKELENMKRLRKLGIMVQRHTVLNSLLNRHIFQAPIRYLGLQYCKGLDVIYLHEFLRRLQHLKELCIKSCDQLTKLVVPNKEVAHHTEDRVEDDGNEGLEVLTLEMLPNLLNVAGGLQPIPCLKLLREVIIKSCPKLENASWVLQLPGLEKVTVSDCLEIEQVVVEAEIEQVVVEAEIEELQRNESPFSKLEMISLKDLPKLKTICSARSFPALKKIIVQNCPNLVKLPFGAGCNANAQLRIYGCDSWWRELEWEGGSVEATFGQRNVFIPI